MNTDFLQLLQDNEPTFSKGQKRIAHYITECYDKAAFMTANRLGKTVGVSESTVVRFAVDLGFDGYPSMQKAMQEMVLNRLTSVQRIEVANDRIGDQDILSMVIQSDIEKLRRTGELVSRDDFNASVKAVLNAKRVFILGVRSAAALEIVTITIIIETIIRLIKICIAYDIKLISSPVVIEPPTISLAPNHEISSIHPYIQNCISGLLKAIIFSAFEKSS